MYLNEQLLKRFYKYFTLSSTVNEAVIAACVHSQFKLKWLPKDLPESERRRIENLCINAVDQFVTKNPQIANQSSSEEEDSFFVLNNSVINQCESCSKLQLISFFNNKNKSMASLDNYSDVKKAFIRYNTSLCSSSPVERLFSFATFISYPARSSLSDTSFETLLFLKGNNKYTKLNNF